MTPDGKRAVSALWDNTLKVWDLETGPRAADAGRPRSRVSGRGGDAGREARGFRVLGPHAEGVGPGERPRPADAGRPRRSVYGVAVTPDGNARSPAPRTSTLKVWDLESGRALQTLEGHLARSGLWR